MTDEDLAFDQETADRLLFCIAERAGVDRNDLLEHVEEESFETLSEEGAYGMETWTVFTASDQEGQTYYAHLPGRLDVLIAQTVRDHSVILGGE